MPGQIFTRRNCGQKLELFEFPDAPVGCRAAKFGMLGGPRGPYNADKFLTHDPPKSRDKVPNFLGHPFPELQNRDYGPKFYGHVDIKGCYQRAKFGRPGPLRGEIGVIF